MVKKVIEGWVRKSYRPTEFIKWMKSPDGDKYLYSEYVSEVCSTKEEALKFFGPGVKKIKITIELYGVE